MNSLNVHQVMNDKQKYYSTQVHKLQGRLEDTGKANAAVKSEGHLLKNSLLLRGSQSSVLFRPPTDWMRPNHTAEGTLPYPKSTDLNVNLIQNQLTETSE